MCVVCSDMILHAHFPFECISILPDGLVAAFQPMLYKHRCFGNKHPNEDFQQRHLRGIQMRSLDMLERNIVSQRLYHLDQ